jgi:hypothetical protein
MNELQRNQKLADRIVQELRADGRTFHSGECVALLDGRVVGVADDLASALKALRSIDPDPARGMVFEVAPPVVDVIR